MRNYQKAVLIIKENGFNINEPFTVTSLGDWVYERKIEDRWGWRKWVGYYEKTLLWVICLHGLYDSCKILIGLGANVNLPVNCKRGMDVDAKGLVFIGHRNAGDSKTPLEVACRKGNLNLAKLLVESGAKIQYKRARFSPLYYSAFSRKGKTDLCEFLIENGAEVNESLKNGWTALLVACQYGYLDVVKLLVNNGADVNQKNNKLTSPLYIAVYKKHYEIAQFLFNNGAKIYDKNNNGKTPFSIATQLKYDELITLFLKREQDTILVFIVCVLVGKEKHLNVLNICDILKVIRGFVF